MRQLRALVVEDDPSHRELLTLLLERQGFEVHAAADGATALADVGALHPDVLLADLSIPCLDGLQLTEAARRLDPMLPVLVLTGHPASEPRVQVLISLPRVAVESKPPHFASLGERLRALVAGQMPAARPPRVA